MKSISPIKHLSMTASTALALCVISGSALAGDVNPFGVTELQQGYQIAMNDDKSTEGKCGGSKEKAEEGKCGENKAKTKEGKCGENKSKDKTKEGKCGEGKCGASK